MTPQNRGRQFEKDLAEEFGIEQVPGSGSVWYSKLDIKGFKARWSLKLTDGATFPLNFTIVREALEACFGPGGDGSTPIWAIRTNIGDFIMLRKEDFKDLQEGNVNFINKGQPKAEARKAQARLPELLRDDGDQ